MAEYIVNELPDGTAWEVNGASIEIDVQELLERLHKKLCVAQEKGNLEPVIVVTSEEFRALQYKDKIPFANTVVRVPVQCEFFSRMAHMPITGMEIFGCPVIGSDFIGEISPFIL